MLFSRYVAIITLKSDDLRHSKLIPRKIHFFPRTQPIKQRTYRIPKPLTEAFKNKLIQLINNNLIVPSS